MSRDLVDRMLATMRDVPDFPKAGVIFKDITPVLGDGPLFADLVAHIASRYAGQVDKVAGVKSRGLIIGAPVAVALGVGFVPIRKAGKLPGETYRADYALEYGTATIEIHRDAFAPGERVLIFDDVLATGGTAQAACTLVKESGAAVTAFEVVIEIESLGGRKLLSEWPVHAIAAV